MAALATSAGMTSVKSAARDPSGPPTFSRFDKTSTKASLGLPRFRGEMRAWDQALWLYVMLSSGFVAFFGSAPRAEPFFRPDPRTDAAAARSGGQGRPLPAAARRAGP